MTSAVSLTTTAPAEPTAPVSPAEPAVSSTAPADWGIDHMAGLISSESLVKSSTAPAPAVPAAAALPGHSAVAEPAAEAAVKPATANVASRDGAADSSATPAAVPVATGKQSIGDSSLRQAAGASGVVAPNSGYASTTADMPPMPGGAVSHEAEDTPLLGNRAREPRIESNRAPLPLPDGTLPIGQHHRWPEEELPVVEAVADQKLRVFCGVWNLHGKRGDGDMEPWLSTRTMHHIYVVGTCECEQTIAKSMLCSNKERWEHTVRDHLGEEYFLVGHHTMSAIHIMVFIHRYLWRYCWNIKTGQVKTGFSNMVGNKGAAQVGLHLGHTSLVFINAHLAAGAKNMEARTKSFTRILHDSPFKCDKGGTGIHEEFDRVFFMGDLNARVNASREKVDELVDASQWTDGNEQLRGLDQLLPLLNASPGSASIRSDSAVGLWPLFSEAPIFFPPTYKFDKQSDQYDSSKKQRVPSWTDRILWKTDENIVNLAYSSVPSLKISDHRPIFGQYEVSVNLKDWDGPDDTSTRGAKRSGVSSVCVVQ